MHYELHTDRRDYNKHFPSFSRPKIIGFLSLDSQRKYCGDASQLKFARNLHEGSVNFDLNMHFDKAKRRLKGLNEKISHLLQFLLDQNKRLDLGKNNNLNDAKFFCYRGFMTCIANTPYEYREPWKIVATLFKGNIYLCALDTDEKIQRETNMSEREKQCTSWGYKFEQFLLSDEPDTEPNTNDGCDENEEFSLVFKTKLNRHTIIFGAEMDGINCDRNQVTKPPSEELGPDATIQYLADKQFIELKTSAHLETPKQHTNFRKFKTRKWYIQSFLAGVEDIFCGFRNYDGVVEELKYFHIDDLRKMSAKFWEPNVCFNFLDSFLTYVKRCLGKEIRQKYGEKGLNQIHNLPLMALHFEWSPQMPVHVTDAYCYESDPILPQWFVENWS